MSNNEERKKRILLYSVIASVAIIVILLICIAAFIKSKVIPSGTNENTSGTPSETSESETLPETDAAVESTAESITDTSNRGTTPGNMQNRGYAVTAGEWIYYYADFNLYKTKTGSDESEMLIEKIDLLLNDTFWGNLNIAEDGNIYFLTMYGSIYRVPADGGTPTIFVEGETTPYQMGVNEFLIDGEWLYYSYEQQMSANNNRSSVIKRIRLDGSDNQILMGDDNDHTYSLLDVAEDYVYYVDGTHEEGYLNGRIPVDGGQPESIDFMPYSSSIQIMDGWLYYRDDMSVNRIRTDGSEQQVIYGEGNCNQMNVTEEWIYCQISEGRDDTDKKYMMRMKTDGTDIQILNDEAIVNFAVAGDVMVTMQDGMLKIVEESDGVSLVKQEYTE